MSELFQAELRAGDTFEAYTIDRCIAEGGLSIVYAAHHTFLGNPCALKMLKLQHAADEHLRELSRAEAIALSRMRHENLVPVLNAGMTATGVVWMEMPLLEGVTVREYVARARLTNLELLRVARDIADGVSAAHECGIVHRDLKPENVFITGDGRVVVLDFGLAKFRDMGLRSTGKFRVGGTYRYMSPEHCRGEKLDARSDQYQLGLIMWETATGRYPYERTDEGELRDAAQFVAAHVELPLPSLLDEVPGFPPPIWAIVERATRKDRNERFPSMVAMASAIRDARRSLQAAAAADGLTLVRTPAPGAARAYIAPEPPAQHDPSPTPPSRRVVMRDAPQAERKSYDKTPEPLQSAARPTEPPVQSRRPTPLTPLAIGVGLAITVVTQLAFRGHQSSPGTVVFSVAAAPSPSLPPSSYPAPSPGPSFTAPPLASASNAKSGEGVGGSGRGRGSGSGRARAKDGGTEYPIEEPRF